jgi:ferredoxin
MVLFLSFVAMSLLLKKAFCSWLCPVGTFSELLGDLGNKLFGRTVILPRWLDIPLRGLKYLLLGFFAVLIGSMSAEGIRQFMETGYGLVADVKMLNFFRTLSLTGGIVLVLLIVLSMVVRNFWCRYLCPYGALLGLVSLASPVKIRRDAEACVDCGGCARSCPAALPVDKLIQIRSVECTGLPSRRGFAVFARASEGFEPDRALARAQVGTGGRGGDFGFAVSGSGGVGQGDRPLADQSAGVDLPGTGAPCGGTEPSGTLGCFSREVVSLKIRPGCSLPSIPRWNCGMDGAPAGAVEYRNRSRTWSSRRDGGDGKFRITIAGCGDCHAGAR